jgi:DNA repair exonuclease SbcCD ATPase subunit
MKIIRLQVHNILRLVAVEIIPGDKPVIQLTGKNAQGKSSVLNAIWMALGGEDTIPSKPIHKGAEKGVIDVQLGDELDKPEYTVRRTFTDKGTYITVTSKEGARYPSPQALLDKLVGDLSFDPLEFTRMRPALQLEELARINPLEVDKKKLVEISGIDLSLARGGPLDLLNYYEEEIKGQRTLASRDAERSRAAADTAWKDAPETPPKEVSVKELIEKRKARQSELDFWLGERRELERLQNGLRREKEDLAELSKNLDEAAAKIKRLSKMVAEKEEIVAAADAQHKAAADKGLGPQPTFDDVDAEMEKAEASNKLAAAHKKAAELEEKAQSAESIAAGVLEKLTAIRAYKTAVQATAKFPLPELSFGDGEVLLNGLPFKQASDAEQLRVSIAIAMAANPKLRVVRVRDGSLLDSDGMKLLEGLAKERDFQVWIETVGEDKTVGVHIEDGQVVAP